MMNNPMSSLSRTSSAASFSSDDINIITPSAINASRRTRKRFTNSQLTMLENLFHRTSHPSREEREAVAKAGQMEIKSVTIWFQNKRQTERKSAASKETTSSRTASPSFSSSSAKSLLSVSGRPSLDKIATRTEMRNHHGSRTPRRHTTSGTGGHGGEHIWDHMPSSPLVPPSPATSDYAEYPKNSRSKRTLEWACAAARASERDHSHHRQSLHQSNSFSHPSSYAHSSSVTSTSHHAAKRTVHRERPLMNTHPDVTPKGAPMDLELTEDEEEEAVTPPNTMMADDPRWYDARQRDMPPAQPRKPLPTDDEDMMKAALALCGLGAGTRRL
ncbi:hypothetical protein BKA70DRAFT_1555289 [Coprinopsis sp. MPI-PUGE-AT-0042]|nr:hypothetical protein BKA70DRAFT_1555289 [Coprinopsis sp. MPI-PUGE-AT-0042]